MMVLPRDGLPRSRRLYFYDDGKVIEQGDQKIFYKPKKNEQSYFSVKFYSINKII